MPGSASKRVTILLHARDPWPKGPSYFAAGLLEAWRETGIEVRLHRGVKGVPRDDLVLPHVDLTLTPPPYAKAIDALPRAINRGVYDISKRRVSRNLLEPGDDWSGPVIVKTNFNHGGRPERLHEPRGRRWLRRARARLSLRRGSHLARDIATGGPYQILPHMADVPAEVWNDSRLVVERFLAEREGEMYFARWYIFIGSHFRSMRVGGTHPLVKLSSVQTTQYGPPIPSEVVALRHAWGLEFGKIDFVVHEGKVVVLDVNRTPSDVPPPHRLAACRAYAPGILPLLDPSWSPGKRLEHIDVGAS